jgi:TrmH family RNA methyltransferase
VNAWFCWLFLGRIRFMSLSCRIVLVSPSHPGNIGAVARAMKNMGLSDLALVNPAVFPDHQATVRASGADDILAQAQVYTTLPEALAEAQWVLGASARLRDLSQTLIDPKQCAEFVAQQAGSKVALVFGRESSGLTNEELSLCHYHVHIPTAPDFASLNLAAAVQVIVYEIFMAQRKAAPGQASQAPRTDLASASAVSGFLTHLNELLAAINYFDPAHPRGLKQRLRRIFLKASLEQTEVNILRGMVRKIERVLGKAP